MSRKPIHLDFVGGKGPRQRIWEFSRGASGEFTVDQVSRKVDVPLNLIRTYLNSLVAAGYLSRREGSSLGEKNFFALVRDVGAEAPRVTKEGKPVTQGLAQEQMWRTLRAAKGDMNARELASFASTEMVSVPEITAKSYLKNLNKAGYLVCTALGKGRGGRGGGIQARYRLIKNTGPRPPMVQRADAIYDPNNDTVTLIKTVNEETAIYGG